MVPTLTQIFWRQPWTTAAEAALSRSLHTLGLSLRELPSQAINLAAGTVGGDPLPDCAFRAPAGPNWSCLHLPSGSTQGDEIALPLAQQTGQPVLVLTEHQQVAWGFSLFHPSEPTQTFLSQPSLLDGYPPSSPVDAGVMARALGIAVERFAPYLEVQSPDDVSQAKAFPDDQFSLGDHWIRVDFLRALGITYPIPACTPDGRFCRFVSSPGNSEPAGARTPEIPTQPEDPSLWRWN